MNILKVTQVQVRLYDTTGCAVFTGSWDEVLTWLETHVEANIIRLEIVR